MVVIRLSRGGSKKRPFYRVVVADKRMPRDGRFIERVGLYNPVASGQEEKLRLEMDRIEYWVAQGAQPSERVQRLIKDNQATTKAVTKPKAASKPKATPKPKAETKSDSKTA